jgi:hypothetical protein
MNPLSPAADRNVTCAGNVSCTVTFDTEFVPAFPTASV